MVKRRHGKKKRIRPTLARPPATPANEAAGDDRWSRARLWGQYAVIALLILVAFHPAFRAEFVWDDLLWEDAPGVIEPLGIFKVWFSSVDGLRDNHYWPVTYSLLWLEYRLFATDPLGYHVVSLLLHFTVSVLIWRILVALGVRGAWLAGLLFALHPIHAEPVTWVISQKDLLSALLQLCAMVAWLRYVDRPWSQRGLTWCAVGLLALTAAILSKSAAATLPATLLIIQWYRNGDVTRTDVLRSLPFFVIGGLVTLAETAHYKTYTQASFDYTLLERMIIASRALWIYAGKTVAPIDLPVIYNHWSLDVTRLANWLPTLGLIGVAVVLYLLRKRTGNGPLAALAFFVISLSPVLGFVDYAYLEFSFVADRYQYLASAGLIALIAAIAWQAVIRFAPNRQMRLVATGLLCAPIALMGFLTSRHAGHFGNNEALFTHITATNPTAKAAYRNLGITHLNKQNWQVALDSSRIAIEQDSLDVAAIATDGASLMGLERHTEALTYAERATSLSDNAPVAIQTAQIIAERAMANGQHVDDPKHARNAAHGFLILEKFDESLDAALVGLEQSLTIEQRHDLTMLAGRAVLGMEDLPGAAEYFERALALARTSDGLNYLALARFNLQQFGAAAALYRDLIALEPRDANHFANLGATLFKMEKTEEALGALDQALALDPTNLSAINNLQAIERGE